MVGFNSVFVPSQVTTYQLLMYNGFNEKLNCTFD